MADAFEFTGDALQQARDFRRMRNKRVAESVFQHTGAAAETLRTGTSMPDALAKRPLSGDWMSAREKLALKAELLPGMGAKEGQQQKLGYDIVNDELNRTLEANKAAMDLQVSMANIALQGSMATLDYQNNAEERTMKGAAYTTGRAQNATEAALRVAQGGGKILDRYTNGEYTRAFNEAYSNQLDAFIAKGGVDPETGLTYTTPENIPAGTLRVMQEQAMHQASVAVQDAFQRFPPEYRREAMQEMSQLFKGGTYQSLDEFDTVHVRNLVADQLGIAPEDLVGQLEEFDPEAAQNITSSASMVSAQVSDANSLLSSDSYRRTHTATGAMAAGADPRKAQAARDLMFQQLQEPGAMEKMPETLRTAVQGSAELFPQEAGQASEIVRRQAVAQAPVVQDIGAQVGEAAAAEMVGKPLGAIERANQALQEQQRATEQQAVEQEQQGPMFMGVPQSTIRQRIPDFQVPSDTLEQYYSMLKVIDEFPELPPVQQARKDLMATPLFADYKKKRGYEGDAEFAFREFVREAKDAQKRKSAEAHEARRQNVDQGIVKPGVARPPVRRHPAEVMRQAQMDAAAASVPEEQDQGARERERIALLKRETEAAKRALAAESSGR